MQKYSRLFDRYYEPERCVFVANVLQASRYMNNGCDKYLVDILYFKEDTKKPDSIVFVFERCPETRRAKELWDKHELN